MHRQKSFSFWLLVKKKKPQHISPDATGASVMGRDYPDANFTNISIPLKSTPSNFRRQWIKSLSAVEVRQRLVRGSKTISSASSPPLSLENRPVSPEQLSQAREAGRGGLEDRRGPGQREPQFWTLHSEKQDHRESEWTNSHSDTSAHLCFFFNYIWYMKAHTLFFILPLQYGEMKQAARS